MKPSNPSDPKAAAAVARVPLALCSPIAKAHWAAAQHAGMCKYGAWNWRAVGVRASVYLSAAQRHLDRYLSGEEVDPVDGTHHLGNLMACAAILLDAKEAGKLVDDRPPSVDVAGTYARVESAIGATAARYADRDPEHYTIDNSCSVDAKLLEELFAWATKPLITREQLVTAARASWNNIDTDNSFDVLPLDSRASLIDDQRCAFEALGFDVEPEPEEEAPPTQPSCRSGAV